MSTTATNGKTNWKTIKGRIIDRLDLATEFEALGVKMVGPKAKGWNACYAIDREESNPSAGVNIVNGLYKDFGGEGLILGFFDLAERLGNGRFAGWRQAVEYYGNKVGVEVPAASRMNRKRSPSDPLRFEPWDASRVEPWCRRRGGIDPEVIVQAGGRLATSTWPKSPTGDPIEVIALPGFATGQACSEPSAWVILRLDGEPLPPLKEGIDPKKILTCPGSHGGLMNAAGLARLEHAEVVWKVEGVTDMLALQSAIPLELRDTHIVITNSGGCQENPKPEWVKLLNGKTVYVVGDADIPGQAGAAKWVNAAVGIAASVASVPLPFAVAENHGKDLRDFLNDAGTYQDLLAIAEAVQPAPQTPKRPTIVLSPELHLTIDGAIAALATHPYVHQRAGSLVRVVRDPIRDRRTTRPPDTPRIGIIPLPTVREMLTRVAIWAKERSDREGNPILLPATPPEAVVSGVAARGEWSGIRPLEAVIEAPTLRPDGTILDAPGYDEATGVLYLPSAKFPPIPDRPTQDDAKRAAKVLLAPVGDFPFAVVVDAQGKGDGGASHQAVWLAALLTTLVRIAIDGPTPLTVFDASTPGAGKTLLAELIALIAFGRALARTPYSEDDAELRKAITSIAMAGDRLVLLDNVASAFGGSALDAALTATVWRDRRLGTNELTLLPLSVVWLASGNNVQFKGDVLRRILHCRLEPSDENPEERDPGKFQIQEPLDRYVLRRRPELVVAALTIVRAYHVAGRPAQKLPAIDFRAWSDLVRNAVFWVTGADPCATRKALVATDTASADRAALVEGWAELPGADKGLTTAEALKKLDENKAFYATLRSALTTRNGELMTARSIGMRLNAIRGRVIDGKSINGFDAGKKTHAWKVVEHPKGGTKGTGGTDCKYAGEKCTDDHSGNGDSYSDKKAGECETVPPLPLVPPREGGTDPQNGDGRERFSL
jgi:hypothetical protein